MRKAIKDHLDLFLTTAAASSVVLGLLWALLGPKVDAKVAEAARDLQRRQDETLDTGLAVMRFRVSRLQRDVDTLKAESRFLGNVAKYASPTAYRRALEEEARWVPKP